ncbi:AraC family transcriptional regulator [Methylophilus sp. QUAN]|nr:AraC family transcriptional regulator [Methylophilus sp. QUAN]
MNNELADQDWVRIKRDAETGIESVHAHFKGHAYDPHDHDEILVGFTQTGVQRFNCGRAIHTSTPGRTMLIEPGALHDGHAPEPEGFTYAMLYIPQSWMSGMTQSLGFGDVSSIGAAFKNTLADDQILHYAIQNAFTSIHHNEGKLARDQSLDQLVFQLSKHLHKPLSIKSDARAVVQRAREYIHAHMAEDFGLEEVADHTGIDRFRLTRQFKNAFGQSPHAYLVRLRLRKARTLLAFGLSPVQVAMEVGFADQSHMGLWFRRAYRMTPASYQKQCTNLTD